MANLARLHTRMLGARLSRCLRGSWFTLVVGYLQAQRPLGLRPLPQCLCSRLVSLGCSCSALSACGPRRSRWRHSASWRGEESSELRRCPLWPVHSSTISRCLEGRKITGLIDGGLEA